MRKPKSEVVLHQFRREGKPKVKVIARSPEGLQSYSYVTRSQCIDLARKLLEAAEYLKT